MLVIHKYCWFLSAVRGGLSHSHCSAHYNKGRPPATATRRIQLSTLTSQMLRFSSISAQLDSSASPYPIQAPIERHACPSPGRLVLRPAAGTVALQGLFRASAQRSSDSCETAPVSTSKPKMLAPHLFPSVQPQPPFYLDISCSESHL